MGFSAAAIFSLGYISLNLFTFSPLCALSFINPFVCKLRRYFCDASCSVINEKGKTHVRHHKQFTNTQTSKLPFRFSSRQLKNKSISILLFIQSIFIVSSVHIHTEKVCLFFILSISISLFILLTHTKIYIHNLSLSSLYESGCE